VRTVVIRYRVDHGLRFFDDHDELYWNVTGDQWPYPIGAARVEVTLPGRVVNVRANAFTGAAGSKERAASITIDGVAHELESAFKPAGESPPPDSGSHVVEVAASRALGIREGLTAAVAWNPGVIKRPSGWARAWSTWRTWFVDHSLLIGVCGAPLLIVGRLFLQWWLVSREPRVDRIVVEYEPPGDLGPGETGTLIDNKPDNRDLIASLVDTAVKGVIRIRAVKPGGLLPKATYAFELLEPESRWQEAGVHRSGQRILRGIFGPLPGEAAGPNGVLATVLSTELEDQFYTHLPEIRNAIFDDLVEHGFYAERPDKVHARYVKYGIISSLVIVAISVVAVMLGTHPISDLYVVVAIVMGSLTALVFTIFAAIMPARTVAGVRTRSAIRGFQEFLSMVDAQRLASISLTPELFERYLPYAIALGIERLWARSFAGICTVPPQWYADDGLTDSFNPMTFTYALRQMSTTATAAMTSSPRTSDDSYFSRFSLGGGFSGGDSEPSAFSQLLGQMSTGDSSGFSDGGCSGGGDGGGGGGGGGF